MFLRTIGGTIYSNRLILKEFTNNEWCSITQKGRIEIPFIIIGDPIPCWKLCGRSPKISESKNSIGKWAALGPSYKGYTRILIHHTKEAVLYIKLLYLTKPLRGANTCFLKTIYASLLKEGFLFLWILQYLFSCFLKVLFRQHRCFVAHPV